MPSSNEIKEPADTLKEAADEWLESRGIIADFLKELNPDQPYEHHIHNAAAVIARLAQANILMRKV